jgi:hypothetical protein
MFIHMGKKLLPLLETEYHRVHESNTVDLRIYRTLKSRQHLARKEAFCTIRVRIRSSPRSTRFSKVTFATRCFNQNLCPCLLSLKQATYAYIYIPCIYNLGFHGGRDL